jgi:hypothetical protein
MLTDPQKLIDEFVADCRTHLRVSVEGSRISHDAWAAVPHRAEDLPIGLGAVYVFSLSSRMNARAGRGRVLKVGKAGPNSNARFRYQHYKAGAALSTLAGAIQNNPLLWGYIGFAGRADDVGKWICQNTDRNNFYFTDKALIGLFEVYAKARHGPVFEGSLSSNA